jgi:UDP:flavonoid glycosyltransferase YjiC (YdhE family)
MARKRLKVLAYTCPSPGHSFPPVATAIAMRKRGHEVAIHTAKGSVEAIGRLGIDTAPIDPRIEAIPLEDWKARTPIGALKSACETFSRRAHYEIPDLQAAIEARRPDLIWVDSNAVGAATVAAASGKPWGICMPYPNPLPAPGVPSFGPGFAPSDSLVSRFRDRGLEAFKEVAFRPFVRQVNFHRRAFGLPPLGSLNDLSLVAPLLVQFSAEPFEYPASGRRTCVSSARPSGSRRRPSRSGWRPRSGRSSWSPSRPSSRTTSS